MSGARFLQDVANHNDTMTTIRIMCAKPILNRLLARIGLSLRCVRRERHDGDCSARWGDGGEVVRQRGGSSLVDFNLSNSS
jgi:hypothetical protein